MALTGFDESQLIPVDEFGFDESQLIPVEEPEIKPPPPNLGIPQITTVPPERTLMAPGEAQKQDMSEIFGRSALPDIPIPTEKSLEKVVTKVPWQSIARSLPPQLAGASALTSLYGSLAETKPKEAAAVLHETLSEGKGMAEFMTSPQGVAATGAAFIPGVNVGLGAYFTSQTLNQIKQGWDEYNSATTPEEKARAATKIGLGVAMTGGIAHGTYSGAKSLAQKSINALKGEPTEVPKIAGQTTGETLITPEGKPMSKGEMDSIAEQNPEGFFDNLVSPDGTKRRVFRTGKVLAGKERFKTASELEGEVRPTDGYPAKGEYFESDKQSQIVQSVIDKGMAENPNVTVKLMDPSEAASRKGEPMWVNAKGEVVLNPQELRQRIVDNKLNSEQIKTWFGSGFVHEIIHSNWRKILSSDLEQINKVRQQEGKPILTENDVMMKYWNDATSLEKALTRRAYEKKWGKGTTPEINLAHEMFRRHQERILGLKPSEVVQSRGMEWLTQTFINNLERGIFESRKVLGTKASKSQQELFDKYQSQIDMIRKAKGWQAPTSEDKQKDLRMTPAEEKPTEEPKSLAFYKTKDQFTSSEPTQFIDSFKNSSFADLTSASNAYKGGITTFLRDAGEQLRTEENIKKIKEARAEEKAKSIQLADAINKAKASGDMGSAMTLMQQRLPLTQKDSYYAELLESALNISKLKDSGKTTPAQHNMLLTSDKPFASEADAMKWLEEHQTDLRMEPKPEEPEKETKETKPVVPPTKPPETVATAPEAEGARYGIAARVSEERAARGDIPGEPIRGPGITAPEAIERGRKLIAQGSDPIKIMDDFEKTSAISGDGMAVIRAHGENLFDAAVKAQRQFGRNSPEYKAAQKSDFDWLQRVKKAQTEWHKMGQAQQGETDIDTGSFHGLQRAFYEYTGRDFTPQQATKADKLAKTNQEATDLETKAKDEFFKAKDETVKDASENGKKVWERAKSYISKGEGSIDDIRHKVATDLGLPVSEVTKLLTETKQHKRLLDDVWKKQEQARRLRTLTKQWLKAQAIPGYLRALSNIPRILFGMKVAFHGTVALGTHAPMLFFQPPWWKTYFQNYFKMYRMVGSPAYYEMQMQELLRRPNYIPGRRAGLQTDPFQYEEYTDPKIAKAVGILTRSGTRGYADLKLLRQDMFDIMWDRLPESDQTPDMAEWISRGINHVTGVTRKGAPKGAHLALFAPRLMGSRAMWLAGDPARAATILLNWKNATPGQKQFAMNQLKEKLWVSGTMFALLAANQGFLKAFGSDQEINFTDVNKSDFLKFKALGMEAAYGNPMITMARLPYRAVQIRERNTGKLKNIILPDAETYAMLLGYARSQLSPAAGLAADQWFMADYQNRPLPSSNRAVPKRLRQQGLGPYTWPEYLSETFSPIPFQEALKEVWKTGLGMSDEQIRQYAKALGTIAFQAGTGARIAEDTHR